jgi:polycomb protein EED
MANFVREKHGHAIWSVAWSTDEFHVEKDDDQQEDTDNGSNNSTENSSTSRASSPKRQETVRYMATCGGKYVSLYQISCSDKSDDAMTLRQAYVDRDDEEVFYCCAFGGHSLGRPFGFAPVQQHQQQDQDGMILIGDSNTEPLDKSLLLKNMVDTHQLDGPQLLCVAGFRGVIKVIDTVQQMLYMTLSGHGADIYDLKFSSTDSSLCISASKDESVRLWNVTSGTCVGIFAGHEGHRDSVLSVAWHPLGNAIASASMDNTVKLWSLKEGTNVYSALQASHGMTAKEWNVSTKTAPTGLFFKTASEQVPYFSSNKIHLNYVDCVQFVGADSLILSKSVNDCIVLWKPNLVLPVIHGRQSHAIPSNDVIVLWEFRIKHCQVWFMRFDTNANENLLLAVGNQKGQIKVWDIDRVGNAQEENGFPLLKHASCDSTIRMVSFSPDGKSLVATCDDATVWKWDATFD